MAFEDLVEEGKTVIKRHLKVWPKFKDDATSGEYGPDGYIDFQTFTTWRNKVIKYVSLNDPLNLEATKQYFEVFEKDFNPVIFAELISFLDVKIKRVPSNILYKTIHLINRLTSSKTNEANETENEHKINWPKVGAIVGLVGVIIALIALLISSDFRNFIQSLHP